MSLSKDAEFWSKTARKYEADPIRNMDGYLNTLERTKSYLPADDDVLEIGCGTGSTALLIAPHVATLTASDLAPGMIEIANEKKERDGLENVSFQVAEIREHRETGATYDAVLAHNLLHLLPDLDQALEDIAALTKPGGVFISKTVCAPQGFSLKFFLINRVAVPLMQAFGKAPSVSFIGGPALDKRIEAAGFEILETSDQTGILVSRYIVAKKT